MPNIFNLSFVIFLDPFLFLAYNLCGCRLYNIRYHELSSVDNICKVWSLKPERYKKSCIIYGCSRKDHDLHPLTCVKTQILV